MDGASYEYVTGHNGRHFSNKLEIFQTCSFCICQQIWYTLRFLVMVDFNVWFRFRELLVKCPKILDFSSDSCRRSTASNDGVAEDLECSQQNARMQIVGDGGWVFCGSFSCRREVLQLYNVVCYKKTPIIGSANKWDCDTLQRHASGSSK